MSDLEVFGKAAPGTGSPSKERGDCPFSQRVFLELEELGLPYTATYIQEGPNKPHWFMVKNPSGLMPVLRDGETWIQDSDKIAEYLDKHCAENTLKTPVEFRDVGSKIFPIFTKWLQSKDPGSPCIYEFVEELVRFDRHLQKHGPYIAGERPTDSDFALAPKLRHARVALAHFMDFQFPQELGALQNYMNRMESRESFEKTNYPDEMIIQGWRAKFNLPEKIANVSN
uniref:DHAR class glutathione S-transferase n=1 Tax=Pinus tabuliformis TaxID=88731 RepID=L7S1R7_PINTB|nr:DHAR class glutathione S-transferase [Pinus tabuliformis]